MFDSQIKNFMDIVRLINWLICGSGTVSKNVIVTFPEGVLSHGFLSMFSASEPPWLSPSNLVIFFFAREYKN